MTPQEIIEWTGVVFLVAIFSLAFVMLGSLIFVLIRDVWRGK